MAALRIGAAQLDLFGEIEAAEATAAAERDDVHHQAVEFLASPWPDLLAWWIDPDGHTIERRLDHGETKASYRRGRIGEPNWPSWAWSMWRDGLHFERGEEWSRGDGEGNRGWSRRPPHVIPWATLHQLRDAHPDELAELRRLSAGRGTPHSLGWRWYACPFILSPWGWHPSYYEGEREQDYYDVPDAPPGAYRDRLKAWAIVVDLARHLGPEVRP